MDSLVSDSADGAVYEAFYLKAVDSQGHIKAFIARCGS